MKPTWKTCHALERLAAMNQAVEERLPCSAPGGHGGLKPGRHARQFLVSLAMLGLSAAFILSGCRNTGPKFDPHQPASAESSQLTNAIPVDMAQWDMAAGPASRTNLYTLGPGDRVDIELSDDPSTQETVLVGPDGKIYYYVLPGLPVWGLNLVEAKDKLESELAKYLRRKPRVLISLREVQSQQIWLLGRLNAPGIYPLNAPTTLLESIAMAGGPAALRSSTSSSLASARFGTGGMVETADLERGFVLRQGRFLPVNLRRLLRDGDMTQNILLQPDDMIYIPAKTSPKVYVLGAVSQPSVIPFAEGMTLISALAHAGGAMTNGHLSQVAIVRGSLSEPQIATLDYSEIVRGKARDVVLEPGDIVYVPLSPYRTMTRYADLILNTFARTIGINEGARAVSRESSPVGVNVPVGP